ncbi:hypothetical protein Lalb_Chr16g0379661 [Lupinus albus]|uniref:Uncharacterized protein n=1 Tax=Lupinus albus TaxID=3870 RepID=A0A6A4PA20_LUPAL|nr:hypothetical protein Lalb_Chr16g0379661 [Lupinus albus]
MDVAVSPKLPSSTFAVAGNESWMGANLLRKEANPFLRIISFIGFS